MGGLSTRVRAAAEQLESALAVGTGMRPRPPYQVLRMLLGPESGVLKRGPLEVWMTLHRATRVCDPHTRNEAAMK